MLRESFLISCGFNNRNCSIYLRALRTFYIQHLYNNSLNIINFCNKSNPQGKENIILKINFKIKHLKFKRQINKFPIYTHTDLKLKS